MSIVQKTDYETAGVDLLIGDLRKPKIEALLRSWLSELQLIENALWQLYVDRRLATAVGRSLAILGAIVGQKNYGWTDDVYRTWIGARIIALRSSGTPEELIAIVLAVTPVGTRVQIQSRYPAALTVHAVGVVDADTGSALGEILQVARSGGVRLLFHWYDTTRPFRYSSDGTRQQANASGYDIGRYSAVSDGRPMAAFQPLTSRHVAFARGRLVFARGPLAFNG